MAPARVMVECYETVIAAPTPSFAQAQGSS